MPSNKARLYVALYARGGAPTMPGREDTYHWSFLVGPKIETKDAAGHRYHAKEALKQDRSSAWYFEERQCSLAPTNMLLVRVLISKVEDSERLANVLRNTPIREGERGWNCVLWIKEALERLAADGRALGTGVIDWPRVRDAAMQYCQRKREQHRFDGQREVDTEKVPTYDLIAGKETMA